MEHVKNLNVPTLILGGGGYTIRNVARCWAYETSVALGIDVDPTLPPNEYLEYYGPEYSLFISPTNMENKNSAEYLEKNKIELFEVLRELPHVPSVQFHETPRDIDRDDVEEGDPDQRVSQREKDRSIIRKGEFYDTL